MERTLLLPLVLCAVAGCTPRATEPVPLHGPWGGDHISLLVTDSGGVLEYDCAHGTIDEPLRPDGTGRFRAAGFHTREAGGPIREGEVPDRRPATYDGEIRGAEMRLTVHVPERQLSLGPFVLRKDAQPRLLKCL